MYFPTANRLVNGKNKMEETCLKFVSTTTTDDQQYAMKLIKNKKYNSWIIKLTKPDSIANTSLYNISHDKQWIRKTFFKPRKNNAQN